MGRLGGNITAATVAGMTLIVVYGGTKPNFVWHFCGVLWSQFSGGLDFRDVQQHDRDVVLNGVDTAADAAFQAGSVGVQDDRLLAIGADQHVQQILRNHGEFILNRVSGWWRLAERVSRPTLSECCDGIESPFKFTPSGSEV